MQDDELRLQLHREVDGLKRVLERALPLARIGRGEHVAVRRCVRDLDGERAEVVQAGKAHLALLEHPHDALHEREADAVAELDAVEAEVEEFLQHLLAILVAA
jgi:hypothetical protein